MCSCFCLACACFHLLQNICVVVCGFDGEPTVLGGWFFVSGNVSKEANGSICLLEGVN